MCVFLGQQVDREGGLRINTKTEINLFFLIFNTAIQGLFTNFTFL